MEKKNRLRLLKIGGVVIFNLICLFSILYVITTGVEKNQASSEEIKVIKEFEGPQKEVKPTTQPTAQPKTQPSIQPTTEPVLQPSTPSIQPTIQPSGKIVIVDDFEEEEIRNRIGGRANVYVRAPSRVMVSRREDVINGKKSKALRIKYDKKNTGGPNGLGGWCGYYTLLKNDKTGQYFDGSDYNYITFWVKGEKGDENFMVGLADEHWDKIGDSLKSEEVGVYLPAGKITTQWQKTKVPLNIFFLDTATLSSITINFEADCFPEAAGSGVVFIDDIALEK